MGFRAKNEIIYSRVYGKTKREFERQMADSGYKNSSEMARYINQYPDLATATSFRFYERAYKNLEDKVLELLERVA